MSAYKTKQLFYCHCDECFQKPLNLRFYRTKKTIEEHQLLHKFNGQSYQDWKKTEGNI